ncbi:hypothetical protein HNQ60_005255 [Povalibacter uvarum]|uniref:DUF6285 domain-containing protein n=1 Tax=Povalibacter uvarum TaxID=732238 RepID=A0A841HU53_9GAMM|nr:DUF6285 domain-containing protein [Povalibacter uvarum]MBB6096333.1 hypothetical protein [Povalibacter uvarum]
MQDHPTPAEILESVATFLRDVVPSKLPPREAFDARVAANAVELVRRQLALNAETTQQDDAERQRLRSLLGSHGSLEELNQQLCARIAAGQLGLDDRELMEHLWTTTLAKVAVDQPTYASYQRTLAGRAGKE